MSTDYNPLPPEQIPPPVTLPPPAPVPVENPPWSLWDIVAIALIFYGSVTIFGLIAGSIAVHVYHVPVKGLERNPRLAIPAEFLAYLVTLGFMSLLVRSRGLPFWRTVRWRRTPGLAAYIVLGFLLSTAVGLLTNLLPIPKQLPIDKYFADTLGTWLLAIFGVTVAPLMEELFFRGFLYPALARPLGVGWSVVLTAAGFAFMHSPQLAAAWAPLLMLFFVGVVLTLIRARTKSVMPAVLVHAAYNFTIFALLFVQTNHFHDFSRLGG